MLDLASLAIWHSGCASKTAGGIANNVDPDQSTTVGAVWSESTLFIQVCLSKYQSVENYILIIFNHILVTPFNVHGDLCIWFYLTR